MKTLSSDEIDALTEIINIGVGRAASSLHDIIGTHIALKVPRVELFPLENLQDTVLKIDSSSISSVLQGFQGDFTGSAALVFPPESAARLVSVLTGDENTSAALDSVRSGTLMEIGNIVINSILGTMGNMLKCNLNFSLPEYRDTGKVSDLISPRFLGNESGIIMLAEANFIIKVLEISGYIFVFFKIDSIDTLTGMIKKAVSGS